MHHSYSPHGLEPKLYDEGWHVRVAKEILKRTKEYEIECWRPEKELKKVLICEEDEITYKISPSFYLYFGREYSLSLLREIKKESKKDDIIIHLHEMHSHLSYLIAYFYRNLPIVAQHHGGFPPLYTLLKSENPLRFLSLLEYIPEKIAFRNIDYFFALTEEEKKYISNLVGQDKVELLTMGVDFDVFKPMDKLYARGMLDLDPNKKYILFVGGSRKEKGGKFLLASLSKIIKKYPNTVLLVAGNSINSDMKSIIKKYEIEKNIKWLGKIDYNKMPILYNAADIFILSSLREGAPIALIEALACEIPVVGTNVGGISEIIKNFKSGLIIPPKDSNAISEAILKILEKPAMFKVNRENGRKYYDWNYIIKRYLKIYEELSSVYYKEVY